MNALDKVATDLVHFEQDVIGAPRENSPGAFSFPEPSLRLTLDRHLTDGDKATRLTPIQDRIMWALMCHKALRPLALAEIVWPDPDKMPDTWRWCLAVQIVKLRKALREFGHDITNTRRLGWSLSLP